MSHEAVSWIIQLPITACSSTAFRVLALLAERADGLGQGAWVSKAKTASVLQCSERTVQRAFRELLALDLIRLGNQNHPAMRARGGHRPTVYDVVTPALRIRESWGVNPVSSDDLRGDNLGPPGETPTVARTTHEPNYQDSRSSPTPVTARDGRGQ